MQLAKRSMENKAIWTYSTVLCSTRAHLRPGVHHIHEVAAGIGPQYGLEHLLILQAASTETWQRLTAAADGSLEGGKRDSSFIQVVWSSADLKLLLHLDGKKKRERKLGWTQTHSPFPFPAHSIWINQPNSFSNIHLVVTRERARKLFVIPPFWHMSQSGAQKQDPQPWEADLTHIKLSRLSNRGSRHVMNVQAYSSLAEEYYPNSYDWCPGAQFVSVWIRKRRGESLFMSHKDLSVLKWTEHARLRMFSFKYGFINEDEF